MERIDFQEARQIELPKWPQALITGPDVTIEQAKEIILRTDQFIISTCYCNSANNTRWGERMFKALGYDQLRAIPYGSLNRFLISDKVKKKFKFLDLSYIHNTWAASCFVYGPYGFCSPEGKIEFLDNVGKWPNVSEIHADLIMIAESFPFLELWCTLQDYVYDDKYNEIGKTPLVTFHIKDGVMEGIYKGTLEPFEGKKQQRGDNEMSDYFKKQRDDPRHEQGLSDEWILELASKTKPFINRLLKAHGIERVNKSRRQREGRFVGRWHGRTIHDTWPRLPGVSSDNALLSTSWLLRTGKGRKAARRYRSKKPITFDF